MQARAADGDHPLAVAFIIAPADDTAEQLAIERLQFVNQAFCRLMREAAQRRGGMQQTGQRHGILVCQRGALNLCRQMPQGRRGDQLRRIRQA